MISKILIILLAKVLYSIVASILPLSLIKRSVTDPTSLSLLEWKVVRKEPNLIISRIQYFFYNLVFIWASVNIILFVIAMIITMFFIAPQIGISWSD